MTPPTPRSTLFPYTTLFRSGNGVNKPRLNGSTRFSDSCLNAFNPGVRRKNRLGRRERLENSSTVQSGSMSNEAEPWRSEEHTSELQSRFDLVCRLLLEKKKR